MNVIARVLADPDFRKGAAVVGIVLLGALVIIFGEIALNRLFPEPAPNQNAPLYLAEDCALCPPAPPAEVEWEPSDEEIAAFLDSTPNGGPQ